jgi:hypothetical protein
MIMRWTLAFVLVVSHTVAAQEPSFQRVGSMSELMVDLIYPTSDAVFYIATRTPTDQVGWNALSAQTLMLAESANLLMMPGRARDQERWMQDAKLLLDVGTEAFKASKAKDVEALEALNDRLYQSCVTCHQHYRGNYGRRPAPGAAPVPSPGDPR